MNTLKEQLEAAYGLSRSPQYQAKRCTARKSRGETCNVCAEICPEKVFPSGKRKHPTWDACSHCGLCAASCPARCITPPVDRVKSFLMAVAKPGPLTLGCDAYEHTFRLSMRCIAAVSWEQLAYAALREGVVISLLACATCGRTLEKGIIRENLRRLRQFLGEERFQEHVTVLSEGQTDGYTPEQPAVSRRDLLRFAGGMTLDRAFSILPRLDTRQDGALFYRAMLRDGVDRARESGQTEKFGMELPRFNEKCYGCGYCVQTCPNKALKLLPGNGAFTIAVDAWKCTGCGICRNTCRVEGISAIAPVKVSHLHTVALGRFPENRCPQCQTPFPRDGGSALCSTCMSRQQALKRREERRALEKEHV